MYVRKFQADSLEEALKEIKRELGPDAIILKTLTNKGLKGAFKKKKIEITAAISEKSYVKKARVDQVLDDTQKETFYSDQSSFISNMIDSYNKEGKTEVRPPQGASGGGYGKVALNRSVQTTKSSSAASSSLDQFLSQSKEEKRETVVARPAPQEMPAKEMPRASSTQQAHDGGHEEINQLKKYIHSQQSKIDALEEKLYTLSQNVEQFERPDEIGLYQLQLNLKALDIAPTYVREIVGKAAFELNEEEMTNEEIVFEFALREMLGEIKTKLPLFSRCDDEHPVVTLLLSDTSCGQSTTCMKLSTLKPQSKIIRLVENQRSHELAPKLLNLDIIEVEQMPEIFTEARKIVEAGESVFIDLRVNDSQREHMKKFLDGFKKTFENTELLITLSAIHSELYNRKVLNRYQSMADGVILTQLDECLNFGSLFNLAREFKQLPHVFYTTGKTIPEDIEAATAERILASLFKF